MGYYSVADIIATLRVYLHFLAVVASWTHEIKRNSEKIWPYSRLRSFQASKVIGLGVNRKLTCDFLLVINSNFGLSATVFDILTLKARKWLFSPPHPSLTPPLGRNPYEFLDETKYTLSFYLVYLMKLNPQKLEGWGYRMVKISWSYLQPFFAWSTRLTDRQTDRRTDGQ